MLHVRNGPQPLKLDKPFAAGLRSAKKVGPTYTIQLMKFLIFINRCSTNFEKLVHHFNRHFQSLESVVVKKEKKKISYGSYKGILMGPT